MKDDNAGSSDLVVVTWNLEWAPPSSARGKLMRERLEECSADVICITEGQRGNLPADGDTIESQSDYGYPLIPHRRKVILWTRHKWREKDIIGSPLLPSGRFAAGTLELPQGAIRLVGVCIPWSAAHVSSGRRDRARWEDHLSYLDGLGSYLGQPAALPTIVLGDFNQTLPRFRQPLEVEQRLNAQILGRGFQPLTQDLVDNEGWPLIDHVCVSAGLSGAVLDLLPRKSGHQRLSDHTGVITRIRLTDAP